MTVTPQNTHIIIIIYILDRPNTNNSLGFVGRQYDFRYSRIWFCVPSENGHETKQLKEFYFSVAVA